jgi:hypothetical protein
MVDVFVGPGFAFSQTKLLSLMAVHLEELVSMLHCKFLVIEWLYVIEDVPTSMRLFLRQEFQEQTSLLVGLYWSLATSRAFSLAVELLD